MKLRKYTPEENKIIAQFVHENPENLKYAFSLAAAKINRTQGAVAVHWYNNLKKQEWKFNLLGKETVVKNTKNISKPHLHSSKFDVILELSTEQITALVKSMGKEDKVNLALSIIKEEL